MLYISSANVRRHYRNQSGASTPYKNSGAFSFPAGKSIYGYAEGNSPDT